MGQNSKTRAWELYEKGRQYNNSLVPNQYRLVNTNIEFFAGNQWINVPMTPAMSAPSTCGSCSLSPCQPFRTQTSR